LREGFRRRARGRDCAARGHQQADALTIISATRSICSARCCIAKSPSGSVGRRLVGRPAESLPFWFQAFVQGRELGPPAGMGGVQGANKKVIDEKSRRRWQPGAGRIRQQQALGFLSGEFERAIFCWRCGR